MVRHRTAAQSASFRFISALSFLSHRHAAHFRSVLLRNPILALAESLFQLGRLYYGQGTSSDTLSVRPADRVAALQAADSVFALVARQAPDSYLGDMWRARTHSAMDPETTEGLAKPYYEKVAEMLLAKNEPRYNSALIECYSYLGYYYLLKSDYPASKEYWNKILAIDPTNVTAKKALDGIK